MGRRVFDIRERSFQFAIEIIELVKKLPKNRVNYRIGDQIIRSGTSIGANIEEAQNCGSKKEFTHILTIALKEARETDYWLRIIEETGSVSESKTGKIRKECIEIIKILTTIVKRSKIAH